MKELMEFMRKQGVWVTAAGIAVGFAFYSLVQTFVTNILDPLVAGLFGTTNFAHKSITMGEGFEAVEIAWGPTVVLLFNLAIMVLFIWLGMRLLGVLKGKKK